MNDVVVTGLRALVDELAAAGVVFARLQDGDDLLEITLHEGGTQKALPASAGEPVVVTARGPGIFHRRPPGTSADLPCLAAGGFLFPVSGPLHPGDEILGEDGVLVDFAAPLIRRHTNTGDRP